MFVTHGHPLYTSQTTTVFGEERFEHRWRDVERQIHEPWFYVEVARQYAEEEGGRMADIAFVASARWLEDRVKEQTELEHINAIYVVTPGWVNKTHQSKMELLEAIYRVDNPEEYDWLIYEVEGGQRYTMEPDIDLFNAPIAETVYSADQLWAKRGI